MNELKHFYLTFILITLLLVSGAGVKALAYHFFDAKLFMGPILFISFFAAGTYSFTRIANALCKKPREEIKKGNFEQINTVLLGMTVFYSLIYTGLKYEWGWLRAILG